jgi:hypothetical protein
MIRYLSNFKTLALAAAIVAGSASMVQPAKADNHWSVGVGVGFGGGGYGGYGGYQTTYAPPPAVYAAPAYSYAPAPAYYYPPPAVVYAPAPAYYYPAPYYSPFTFNFGFGYYGGGYGHGYYGGGYHGGYWGGGGGGHGGGSWGGGGHGGGGGHH